MSADVFVELMEMIAPKWDPIRGKGGQSPCKKVTFQEQINY